MGFLLIGKLNKPYALKGEIKAEFYVDGLDELKAFSAFYIKDAKAPGGYSEFPVDRIYMVGGNQVVTVKGASHINQVESYRGLEIFVKEEELPEAGGGSFYIKDLADSKAILGGELFGTVKNVIDIAGRFMLVIRMNDGKDLVVPFDDRYVPKVDVKEKTVTLQSVDELL